MRVLDMVRELVTRQRVPETKSDSLPPDFVISTAYAEAQEDECREKLRRKTSHVLDVCRQVVERMEAQTL